MTTCKHEDKDENQGDKMRLDENIRLICQILALNPLTRIEEVTIFYIVRYMH